MSIKNKIGIFLFLLYVLQSVLPFQWGFIENLQGNESYKRWSGLLLFTLILLQWALTISRVIYKKNGVSKKNIIEFHQWLGALSPLIFYIHSASPGYALLLFLTIIFFFNYLLGFIYNTRFKPVVPKYFYIWFGLHVLCSAIILFVSIVHIWIVFYFS